MIVEDNKSKKKKEKERKVRRSFVAVSIYIYLQIDRGGIMSLPRQLHAVGTEEFSNVVFFDKLSRDSPLVAQSVPTAATTTAAVVLPATRSQSRNPSKALQGLTADLKALLRVERLRLASEEAARAEVLSRTVHLRFLPTSMRQGDLAALCAECGTYTRVRICGNSVSAQNWIYGFVEFADRAGAERMLLRSGTELSNGPGRPPLRLKCNSAKQVIVDRIFHDANPVTNTPCIFGLGSFANRTLKEAVESYYNLKRKDCGAMTQYPNVPGGSRQYYINHNNNSSNNISVDNYNSSTSNNSSNSNERLQQLTLQHYVKRESDNFSLPRSPEPVCYSLRQGGETMAITPHFKPSWTNKNDTLTGEMVAGSPSSCSPHGAQRVCSNYHCGVSKGDGVVRGKNNFLLNHCSSPVVGHENFFPLTPSVFSSKTCVVVRGKRLILEAIRYAKVFFATGENFYASVGSLQAVIKVFDEENEKTMVQSKATRTIKTIGNNGDVDRLAVGLLELTTCRDKLEKEKEDKEEDIEETVATQRITQMRILSYLLLSLLYTVKGNNEESLQAINRVVALCRAIPTRKLETSMFSVFPVMNNGTNTTAKQENVFNPSLVSMENDGFNLLGCNSSKDTICNKSDSFLDPFNQSMNFFSNIDMERENEQEAAIVSAAMGVVLSDEQDTFLTESQLSKEKTMYLLNVQLQSYVLNVLLTIAFLMEQRNFVVTYCVYSFACARAKEVFGFSATADLEQKSTNCGVNILRNKLLLNVDSVDFTRVFFESLDPDALMTDELFWSYLPPLHMVRWFSSAA